MSTNACRGTPGYARARTLLEALPESENTVNTDLMLGYALMSLGENGRAEQILARTDAKVVTEAGKLSLVLLRATNLLSCGRTTEALTVNDDARATVQAAQGRERLRANEGAIRAAAGETARGLALLASLPDRHSPDTDTDADADADADMWLAHAGIKASTLAFTGQTSQATALAEKVHAASIELSRVLSSLPCAHMIALVIAHAEAGRVAMARTLGEQAFADLITARAAIPAQA